MAFRISPPSLYDALKAEGYNLPEETADIEMLMPVDGLAQLRLIVNLTTEDMAKVGRALCRITRPTDQ